jgi:hypothetical protein
LRLFILAVLIELGLMIMIGEEGRAFSELLIAHETVRCQLTIQCQVDPRTFASVLRTHNIDYRQQSLGILVCLKVHGTVRPFRKALRVQCRQRKETKQAAQLCLTIMSEPLHTSHQSRTALRSIHLFSIYCTYCLNPPSTNQVSSQSSDWISSIV